MEENVWHPVTLDKRAGSNRETRIIAIIIGCCDNGLDSNAACCLGQSLNRITRPAMLL